MQFRGRPVLAIALVVLFMLYITHSLLNGRARDKVALGDHLIFPGAINASAKDKPTLVLLIAYMRGGSSFFGSTFSMNPDVFYWYEPVWELYNSMAAVHGVELPIHSLYYPDGREREMTWHEHDYVMDGLASMFRCEFDQMPTEMSTTWWTLREEPNSGFTKCLFGSKNSLVYGKPLHCQIDAKMHNGESLRAYCGDWISRAFQRGCHAYMAAAHGQPQPLNAGFDRRIFPPVERYRDCMRKVKEEIKHCLPVRINGCKSRNIRAAKIIRLRMREVEELIQRFSDMDVKVIHQLRDPRGTLLSRRTNQRLSFNTMEMEAKALCRKMVSDIHERHELERKYRGIFLETRYEDLADNPSKVLSDMYAHIGHAVPIDVYDSLIGKKGGKQDPFGTYRKNSSSTAHAWLQKLGGSDKALIDAACMELYHIAGYTV